MGAGRPDRSRSNWRRAARHAGTDKRLPQSLSFGGGAARDGYGRGVRNLHARTTGHVADRVQSVVGGTSRKETQACGTQLGALALWRSGALALWRSGLPLALWRSGALALWRSGALALWRSGALALWRSGALALWRSGALNCIGDCTHAVPCPCRDCSQTATRLNSVRGARVNGIRCVCAPCVRLLHSRRLLSFHGLRTFLSYQFNRLNEHLLGQYCFLKSITDHRLSKARKSIPPSARAWTAGLAGVAPIQ